jgi:hypothetical protein
MDDALPNIWRKLSLSEESLEVEGTVLGLENMVDRSQSCLVGKLFADRIIGRDIIKSTLIRGWKPSGTTIFKNLGHNMFLVEFENGWDKSRVLEGRPWVFEGNLFSVEDYNGLIAPDRMEFSKVLFWVRMFHLPLACMNETMGVKIGCSVGEVEEVETDVDGIGWGEYLRVRIRLDIMKPLARGRVLKLNGESSWIEFQYERLPTFCFRCGVIQHRAGGCSAKYRAFSPGESSQAQFGTWLRASPAYKRHGNGRGWNEGVHGSPTTAFGSAREEGSQSGADSGTGIQRHFENQATAEMHRGDSRCLAVGTVATGGCSDVARSNTPSHEGNMGEYKGDAILPDQISPQKGALLKVEPLKIKEMGRFSDDSAGGSCCLKQEVDGATDGPIPTVTHPSVGPISPMEINDRGGSTENIEGGSGCLQQQVSGVLVGPNAAVTHHSVGRISPAEINDRGGSSGNSRGGSGCLQQQVSGAFVGPNAAATHPRGGLFSSGEKVDPDGFLSKHLVDIPIRQEIEGPVQTSLLDERSQSAEILVGETRVSAISPVRETTWRRKSRVMSEKNSTANLYVQMKTKKRRKDIREAHEAGVLSVKKGRGTLLIVKNFEAEADIQSRQAL